MALPDGYARSLVVFLLIASAPACAPDDGAAALDAPDDSSRASPSREDPARVGVKTQALLGGAIGNQADPLPPNFRAPPPSGAVEVLTPTGSCSGVMIGSSMVLTAAHCLKPSKVGLPADSGYFEGSVSLATGGQSWICLTGTSQQQNGKCAAAGTISYERYRTDDIPAEGVDLMVLFPGDQPSPWRGNSAHRAARRIFAGKLGFELFAFVVTFGRGFGTANGRDDGIMRYARFYEPSTDFDSPAFQLFAPEDYRWCLGDSGGPVEHDLLTGVYGAVVGLVVSLNVGLDIKGQPTVCAAAGAPMNAVKFTMNKLGWINDMRRHNQYPECSFVGEMLMECP